MVIFTSGALLLFITFVVVVIAILCDNDENCLGNTESVGNFSIIANSRRHVHPLYRGKYKQLKTAGNRRLTKTLEI